MQKIDERIETGYTVFRCPVSSFVPVDANRILSG